MSNAAWWDELEAEVAAASDCPRWGAEWYGRMRDLYLARFPDADQRSKDNMRMFVERAEALERTGAV